MSATIIDELRTAIRDVPDFPKKGIIFKDITTLIQQKQLFKKAVDQLAARYEGKNIDIIACVEARGFIFGGALAYKLGAGMVPIRKKGKLPHDTHSATYELEYGTDSLEIHKDAIKSGEKVVLIDDLLATGGTACATAGLIQSLGAELIEIAFLVELGFLNGREKLKNYNIFSIIKY